MLNPRTYVNVKR